MNGVFLYLNKFYIQEFLYCYISPRLWQHVTTAINNNDQIGATNEKFILEETQRNATRERKAKMIEHAPRLFERDELTGEWIYKYAE